jgi:hypothetical protein
VLWLQGAEFQREDQHMIRKIVSRSFMVMGSAMLIFGVVAGTPISAKGETAKVMDEASTDGFIIAQTNGMERRQDRRDTRQDCRQDNGAVGQDKRNCKQQGRQN